MHSKTKYILASIFERFWWILATKLGAMCLQDAKTAQLGAQDGPRAAQEAPKTVKNRQRAAPEATRNRPRRALEPGDSQEPPRFPPDLDFGPLWQRFWNIFARFLKDFGMFL